MIIESVQLADGGGYRLNGVIDVPNAPANSEYQLIQEWIAEGNTPGPIPVEQGWLAIRAKRDSLIRESDWTMTPGATVDQAH